MPRHSRVTTEYMHLIVRGIGKQLLFEDDWDRKHFLNLLKQERDEYEIVIFAYCLMDNHVHLLISDKKGTVALFMKKIGECYAQYYNKKYERTGHVFQNRYKSENVTDRTYFLTVYRYILKNPEKAGLSSADTYAWNSYREFGRKGQITDTEMLQAMIGYENYDEFLGIPDEKECMDYETEKCNDAYALKFIHEDLGLQSGTLLQGMQKKERNVMISKMKKRGMSSRQIERLTGIGRGIVNRVK